MIKIQYLAYLIYSSVYNIKLYTNSLKCDYDKLYLYEVGEGWLK